MIIRSACFWLLPWKETPHTKASQRRDGVTGTFGPWNMRKGPSSKPLVPSPFWHECLYCWEVLDCDASSHTVYVQVVSVSIKKGRRKCSLYLLFYCLFWRGRTPQNRSNSSPHDLWKKYLHSYEMDCPEISRHLWTPEDESDFDNLLFFLPALSAGQSFNSSGQTSLPRRSAQVTHRPDRLHVNDYLTLVGFECK